MSESAMPDGVAEVEEAISRYLAADAASSQHAWLKLVEVTSAIRLRKVNTWERLIRRELALADSSDSAKSWKFWRRGQRFATWLDLCSANGWRREAILRTAKGPAPNALFLAFAIRRLNDWVPEVRAAAHEHLLRLAIESDPKHVADALWISLAHSASWSRMDADATRLIGTVIELPAVRHTIRSKLLTSTDGPTGRIFSQICRATIVDSWLEEIALTSVQPTLRTIAYKFLLQRRATWVVGREWRWIDLKWGKGRFESIMESRAIEVRTDPRLLIMSALKDRSYLARVVGADAFVTAMNSFGAEATVIAQALAADSHKSVAERGQYALGKLDG